jgi:hypothetical protein
MDHTGGGFLAACPVKLRCPFPRYLCVRVLAITLCNGLRLCALVSGDGFGGGEGALGQAACAAANGTNTMHACRCADALHCGARAGAGTLRGIASVVRGS